MLRRIRAQRASERGAGVFSMAFGLLFFFVFLVFAVQVTYNLYATSVISSLALEAAHDVARDGGSIADARNDFNQHVGPDANLTLVDNGQTVTATVSWESKALFPSLSNFRAFGTLDRTFVVRVEEQQAP